LTNKKTSKKLGLLAKSIKGFDSLDDPTSYDTRAFMKQGDLSMEIIEVPKKPSYKIKSRTIFLFSDVLLITSRGSSKKYQVKYVVALRGATLNEEVMSKRPRKDKETKDNLAWFELIDSEETTRKYVCGVKSIEEKKLWCEELQSALLYACSLS